MYRIPAPSADELNDYYIKYGNHVKKLIQRVLTPGFYIKKTLGQDPTAIKVRLGIIKGSYTEWFLNHYKEDCNLRKLLTSNIEGLLEIIDHVQLHVPDFKKSISKTKYGDVRANQTIDDFNAICRYIFVDSFFVKRFKGKTIFNRTEFIENRNLKVCPYCGAEDIRLIRDEDGIIFQPPIDHYFPKSLYPFLALSFFNLIPSCDKCNKIPNKGDFDPYAPTIDMMPLTNPYYFDERWFKFNYTFTPPNHYDVMSYKVNIEYTKEHLHTGYTEGIGIEKLYRYDLETPRLWGHVSSICSQHYRDFAHNLFECHNRESMITESDRDSFIAIILDGCKYWSQQMSERILKYKFKNDILLRMLENMPPKLNTE